MFDLMPFVEDDGGRAEAGFKGSAGDCVARSVAIAAGLPYGHVYAELASGAGAQRRSRRTGKKKAASARDGINTRRKWFKDYMAGLGFVWTPTMAIGQGCTKYLAAGHLPPGRLVVAVSKHYTAVIDGVIHDTHNPQRQTIVHEYGDTRIAGRCVYGYWMRT